MSQPHNSTEETKMKLYGAIDLHSTNNVTVVIDEQDRVVYQKRLPNDLALILMELSVYQTELQGIVVESTYNWYWLVNRSMNCCPTGISPWRSRRTCRLCAVRMNKLRSWNEP